MSGFFEKVAKDNEPSNIPQVRYAGFNIRLFANLIDSLLIFLVFLPFIIAFKPELSTENIPPEVAQALELRQQGKITQQQFLEMINPVLQEEVIPKMISHSIINMVVIGVIFILVWYYTNTTPGKSLLKLRIVDSQTLGDPSRMQYLIRYLGYIVATIPLGFGFLMIPFNKKKMGLHDFMAKTTVIITEPYSREKEIKKLKVQTYILIFFLLAFAVWFSTR